MIYQSKIWRSIASSFNRILAAVRHAAMARIDAESDSDWLDRQW